MAIYIELSHSLFPFLQDPELEEVIKKEAIFKEVPAGKSIIDPGMPVTSIPILVEGIIKVLRESDEGEEILLYYLFPGDTCAMSLTCCMASTESQIRAVAEEDSSLIMIPVKFMDRWMQQYPSWKQFVMRSYSARFEELLKTIDLIAFHQMDERLIKYLKEKSRIHQSNEIRVTHQEIAMELNASREAISRLLKKLENMGRIRLSRNQIELVDI